MRKLTPTLAVLGLAAFTLTSCATPSFSAQCERPAQEQQLGDIVTVTGTPGAEPTVTTFTPLRTSELKLYDLDPGTGPAIASPDQTLVIDLVLYRGESGERLAGTNYDENITRKSTMKSWADQLPGLGAALECAQQQTRIVALLSPEDVGEMAQSAFALAEDESLLAVIDVHKVYLHRAEGRRVFNTDRGVPSVVRAPDGRPGVVIPSTQPPAELITQVLIQGDGAPITAEHSFHAHFSGFTWAQRKQFNSTWGNAPERFHLDALIEEIEGVAQALEGQRVGSQVLIVVPPELGYGDRAQGSIPANSTLVFVFDILGVDAFPDR